MAGIKEIAIGVATVMGSGRSPNPLFVDLRNESPNEAVAILGAVIDECVDADISISKVCVDPVLYAALPAERQFMIHGVVISADPGLTARIAFYLP